MKKICHLTSVHPRYDVRIFLKECASLSNNGYDITLLCADNKPDEVRKGVKILSIKFYPKYRISRMLKVGRIMLKKALKINADIYHFHDPELLSIGLELKRKGKIVIYDAHEDVPRQIYKKTWIPKFFRRLISCGFEKYENYIVKKLDHVLTATPHIAERFKRICKHVTIINNYPILAEFNDKVSWSKKSNSCCYIGSLSSFRGVYQIINAVGLIKIELHLCGKFSSKKTEHEVRNLPFYKYVNNHGFSNRSTIKQILRKCKIGLVTLLPTDNYIISKPVKMFEYMAAGIPVVASNFPLWEKIIEENNCGLCVDPFDISEISKAIKFLIQNNLLAEQMGKNGRNLIEKEMNWEKQSEELINLYQKYEDFSLNKNIRLLH